MQPKQQEILRKEARMAKHQERMNNIAQDEALGIKHGVGASIKRTLVGGQKTGAQRIRETEKLENRRMAGPCGQQAPPERPQGH